MKLNFEPLSNEIIGCAIEVHKILGPGMLESAYEECLSYELMKKRIWIERQKPIPVNYKEINLECGYRIDLLVEHQIVIELKSVEDLSKIHTAQLLTYMRFANIKIGLLINFNTTVLKNGIRRFIL
jgi:GxxExxY protein